MDIAYTIDKATGNLIISADAEARDWLRDELDGGYRDELDILIAATEGYWTNSSYRPFDAGDGNPFVGLTSAPCIAEDMSFSDDGEWEVVGRLWWFPDYAVRSFAEELRDTGRTVFTLAH